MRRIDRRARGPGLDLAVMNHPSALRFPFREIANQVRAESRMVKVGGFNAKYAKDAEKSENRKADCLFGERDMAAANADGTRLSVGL